MTLVCIHGWGFGPEVWDGIGAALGRPCTRLDLGFTGADAATTLPVDADTVVVGHSLGFLWALDRLRMPPKALIALNGFTRFTAQDGAPGVAPRVLERMRRGFGSKPDTVLQDFLLRCGTDRVPAARDDTKLAEGLRWLAEWDRREAFAALACPTLVLAGRDDPIVPPDMTRDQLNGPTVRIEWAEGGHLLPLTHPDWCAQRIQAFLEALA